MEAEDADSLLLAGEAGFLEVGAEETAGEEVFVEEFGAGYGVVAEDLHMKARKGGREGGEEKIWR